MTEKIRQFHLSCKHPAFNLLSIIFLLTGCNNFEPKVNDDFLIRIGKNVVTLQDYYDAFELAKVAYPHNTIQNPALLKELRLKVLDQLSDELVLLNRAQILQIDVTDIELAAAIDDIKKDYPEKLFQQTFLESAISYPSWTKRMRIRLIMDKVIKKDLENRVELAPEDITQFYKRKNQIADNGLDFHKEAEIINKDTIDLLRRDKAENAYQDWMRGLRQTYPVEINEKLWKKISDS